MRLPFVTPMTRSNSGASVARTGSSGWASVGFFVLLAAGALLLIHGVGQMSQSLAALDSSPVSLDLTDVFRITVDWTSSNTAGTEEDQSGAIIAVGSPRILCSF